MRMELENQGYQPGVCNIGPDEIQKRKRIGYIGLALTILFIAAVSLFDLPEVFKWFIFGPVVYAVSGFVQARRKFCFLFGISGISKTDLKYVRTKLPEAKSADVRKAIRMIAEIVIISAILTALYVFVS